MNPAFTGAWGEVLAARYLRDHGYEIRTANYRTRLGEVDVIAEQDGVCVFVEVKTRGLNTIAQPMESVDSAKQRKLILAAKQYLASEPPGIPARFDVIEVYLDDAMQPVDVRHIPNAFDEQ